MSQYQPNKKISVQIESNDLSGTNGYTVWHVRDGKRLNAMSRRADGKDFDWMDAKQEKQFENGAYQFKMSISDAIQYFNYIP